MRSFLCSSEPSPLSSTCSYSGKKRMSNFEAELNNRQKIRICVSFGCDPRTKPLFVSIVILLSILFSLLNYEPDTLSQNQCKVQRNSTSIPYWCNFTPQWKPRKHFFKQTQGGCRNGIGTNKLGSSHSHKNPLAPEGEQLKVTSNYALLLNTVILIQ